MDSIASSHELHARAGTRRHRLVRKRHLKPEQVLDIVARVRDGEHREDVAGRYGIGTSEVGHIMNGRAWSGVTGIRKNGENAPNERHATVLLQHFAQDPKSAPAVRSRFDAKFGPGAATRIVKSVMTGAT